MQWAERKTPHHRGNVGLYPQQNDPFLLSVCGSFLPALAALDCSENWRRCPEKREIVVKTSLAVHLVQQ